MKLPLGVRNLGNVSFVFSSLRQKCVYVALHTHTHTAAKSSSFNRVICVFNLVYRCNQVVFYSAASGGDKKKKNWSGGCAAQTDVHSEKQLYSSRHSGPCVTCLRMATIIDDRGEDCYA